MYPIDTLKLHHCDHLQFSIRHCAYQIVIRHRVGLTTYPVSDPFVNFMRYRVKSTNHIELGEAADHT